LLTRCGGGRARRGADSVARVEEQSFGEDDKDLSQMNPCLKQGTSDIEFVALHFS
jgi:hypothetical protein